MGKNAAARLREGGVDITKTDKLYASLADIWAPPKGHPLFHPRFGDPPDRAMIDSIKADGVQQDIIVREEPQGDGSRRLLLVDGGRRTRNAIEAQRELGRPLKVPIRLFVGDDAAVLVERIRANKDPLKKADSASVLALTVRQLAALGPLDVKATAAAMGVKPVVVEALTRWGNLSGAAVLAFNEGRWPLELLPAVLDAPRGQQVDHGDRLVASGIRTAKGATQRANRAKSERDPWARRMSPRQASAASEAIGKCEDLDATYREGVSVGMLLASLKGDHLRNLLESEPKALVAAIREAQAGKIVDNNEMSNKPSKSAKA